MSERTLVRELIGPAVTCAPGTPVAEVARLLLARDLEGVVVLNDEGHAVGVVGQDVVDPEPAQDVTGICIPPEEHPGPAPDRDDGSAPLP